jgi:hypothetical protein
VQRRFSDNLHIPIRIEKWAALFSVVGANRARAFLKRKRNGLSSREKNSASVTSSAHDTRFSMSSVGV